MYIKHLCGPWPDFLARASVSALCRAPLLLILFLLPVIGLPLVIAAFPALQALPGLAQAPRRNKLCNLAVVAGCDVGARAVTQYEYC